MNVGARMLERLNRYEDRRGDAMRQLVKHWIEFCSAVILGSVVAPLGLPPLLAAAPTPTPLPADASAQQILDEAGVSGGLVVHLGCGRGELTTQLRE